MQTENKKEQYLEPVNFKGSKGEWESRGNKIFVKGTYNSIGQSFIQETKLAPDGGFIKPDTEAEANHAILVNSKQLAKALQDAIEHEDNKMEIARTLEIDNIYPEWYKNAKQVLKEAGLKQD